MPIHKRRAAFLLLPIAILAILLYWSTMRLPLLYDDLLHIRIAHDLNFLSVWLPTEAFGFYRPMTFFPLLLIRDLFSGYPSTLLHGMNVFQHAANGVLLGWLSLRLWRRWHWALAAGVLFTFFPFSYQSVAVYGHNVHLTIVNLLLLALHTYLSGIRSSGKAAVFWWFLTGFLFLLSLLSHESAIIFGFLAAGIHLNDMGHLALSIRGKDSFFAQPWFYFLAAGGIYFIGYQFLPLSRSPQASFGAVALQQKAYYLLQAAAFPVAWFGKWLPAGRGIWALMMGIVLMGGLSAWAAKENFNRRPLLLGWSWWLLASLVIAIPLSASYLLHGPRLLYLSGAGIAILWPVLLEPVWNIGVPGRILWTAIFVFVMTTSGLFVRDRLRAYEQLTQPIDIANQVMQGQPPGQGIVFINLPSWLAPGTNTYPIGVEITAAMADYLFIEEYVKENLGSEQPVQTWEVADLLSEQNYHYAVYSRASKEPIQADWNVDGSHIFVTHYGVEGPETTYNGLFTPISFEESIRANFGPYHLLSASAVRCDGNVDLQSAWRIDSPEYRSTPVTPTTSIFVQELDEVGQIVSQYDGPLLGLRSDLLELPSDWNLMDRRSLLDPADRGSRLIIGVYDYISGERFEGYDDRGERLADDALTIPLQSCP